MRVFRSVLKSFTKAMISFTAITAASLLCAPLVLFAHGCGGSSGAIFVAGIGQTRTQMGRKLSGAWQTSVKTKSGHHIYIEFVHHEGALRGRAWFHTGDVTNPVGSAKIRDVAYDPGTGEISFEFTSPTGQFSSQNFRGSFTSRGLQGKLSSPSRSRDPFITETITFFGITTNVTVPNFALPVSLPFSGTLFPQGQLDQNNNPIQPPSPCTETNAVTWPPCGQYSPSADWYGSNSLLLLDASGHFALYFFDVSFNINPGSLAGDTQHACYGGCTFSGTATMTPTYFASNNGDTGWSHKITLFGMDTNLSFAGPGPNNIGTISGVIGAQQIAGQTVSGSINNGLVNLPITFAMNQNFNVGALFGTNTAYESVNYVGTMSVSPQLVANPIQMIGSFTGSDSSDAIGNTAFNWFGSGISFAN